MQKVTEFERFLDEKRRVAGMSLEVHEGSYRVRMVTPCGDTVWFPVTNELQGTLTLEAFDGGLAL